MADDPALAPDAALGVGGAVPPLPNSYTRIDMHRDFKRAFSTPEGRRVLGHILQWAGLWSAGPVVGEQALVHEGQRRVGLLVMQWCEAVVGRSDQEVNYGGRSRPKR